jgi:hypothetical protein
VIPELLGLLAHSEHRELIRNTTGAVANLASENGTYKHSALILSNQLQMQYSVR